MLSTFLLALLALAQQGDTGISEEELAAVKNSSSVTVKAKQVSKLMPTYPKLEGRRRLDALQPRLAWYRPDQPLCW